MIDGKMKAFKSKVVFLKGLIDGLEEVSSDLKAEKDLFALKIKSRVDEQKDLQAKIDEVKEELNALGVEEYNESETKNFPGGLKINMKKVKSYDAKTLEDWCYEKKMFLKVDTKAFEKAAPGLKLNWYKEDKVPSMTYPKVITLED